MATKHLRWLVVLLVGIYVLRRVLDFIAERTGLRVLGLLVVLIESFFLLLVITGGIRVLRTFLAWLDDRTVMQWLAAIKNALADFFAIFKIDLPEILTRTWALLAVTVWPVLVDVIAQPMLWLAVAALVCGSKVLSLAEVWRKGQPYAARIPVRRLSHAIGRSEHFVTSDHRRKVFASQQRVFRRPSSATLTTNICRHCTPYVWCFGLARSSWARTSSSTTW